MRKKKQYQYLGCMLIVLAVGVHFQIFQGFFTSSSPVAPTNATKTNGTATNSSSQDLNQQILGAFVFIDTYWLYFLVFGFSILIYSGGILNYQSKGYDTYPSYHSTTLPAHEEDETEQEEIPEARSAQKGSAEVLKCPHCAAPLKFGSSTVTACEYCGNEVRRKEES